MTTEIDYEAKYKELRAAVQLLYYTRILQFVEEPHFETYVKAKDLIWDLVHD
jgi:hypothetical protein